MFPIVEAGKKTVSPSLSTTFNEYMAVLGMHTDYQSVYDDLATAHASRASLRMQPMLDSCVWQRRDSPLSCCVPHVHQAEHHCLAHIWPWVVEGGKQPWQQLARAD
jgi:hypothetical protein